MTSTLKPLVRAIPRLMGDHSPSVRPPWLASTGQSLVCSRPTSHNVPADSYRRGVTSGGPPSNLGLDLRRRGTRPCGVCGEVREMTKAHVPPQAAGNTGQVTSASTRIVEGVLGPGRFSTGGLWLRGLCRDCNSVAGGEYDPAYADFSRGIESFMRFSSRGHLPHPQAAPAVSVSPGRVARCVLFGLFGISPNLRVIFPDLADALRRQDPHIKMPDGVSLRWALYGGRRARLAGPIHAHRVLGRPEAYLTSAEIYFRPLAWVLAPRGRGGLKGYESVLDREQWANADEWPQYGLDVTSVDLRNLTRRVPVVVHPMQGTRDQWVELFSDEITPILEGVLPD